MLSPTEVTLGRLFFEASCCCVVFVLRDACCRHAQILTDTGYALAVFKSAGAAVGFSIEHSLNDLSPHQMNYCEAPAVAETIPGCVGFELLE